MPSSVAITLALITKEVYSSLFIGVVIGAVFFAIGSDTGLDGFIMHLLNETVGECDNAASYGIIHSIADSWNVGILIAFVAFRETRELNASFYVGIGMVVLSVVLQTLRSVRKKQSRQSGIPQELGL